MDLNAQTSKHCMNTKCGQCYDRKYCTPIPRENMGSITEFKIVDKGRVLQEKVIKLGVACK